MIRVTIKDLLGRKLRLALTSLAIVMGVGMVSGTYVLTDTINAGIGALFGVAYANTDAVVSGKAVFGKTGPLTAPAFPASALGRIEGLPGVAAAGGDIRARAQIVGADGKVISRGGTSGYGFSIDPGYERFTPLKLVGGTWPAGSGQVAIDAQTADSQHLQVGDRVGIIVKGGAGTAVHDLRDRGLRQLHLARRGDPLDLRPRDRTAALRQAGRARPDRRRCQARRVRTRRCSPRSGRCCPPHTQVRTASSRPRRRSTTSTRPCRRSATSCSPSAASRSSSAHS